MLAAEFGKEAKFRRGIRNDFLRILLQNLRQTQRHINVVELHDQSKPTNMIFDDIKREVEETRDFLDAVEDWENKMLDKFSMIQRHISIGKQKMEVIMKDDSKKQVKELEDILEEIKELKDKVPSMVSSEPRENRSEHPPKSSRPEAKEPSNSHNQENEGCRELSECMKELDPHHEDFLYALAIFPEHTQLKKRLLVYWWVGLGLPLGGNRTVEQSGEIFFSFLVDKGILKPVHIREHNQVVDCCTINPKIHRELISSCEQKNRLSYEMRKEGSWRFYSDDRANVKALLNLDQKYLNSTDISKILPRQVVQLGRWYYIEPKVHNGVKEIGYDETNLKDHIELDESRFLGKLGEHVTYLSLRGISRIQELPESIGKLEELMILDLKDCHNLQRLPDKPKPTIQQTMIRAALPKNNKWLKNLTHLNISGCYLLDHMPKWVCELSTLQVLKGAVFNGFIEDQCLLRDLSKLNNLVKLSIKIIHNPFLTREDFSGLESLNNLLVLTIIWGIDERSERPIKEKPGLGNSGFKQKLGDETEENSGVKEIHTDETEGTQNVPTISLPKNLEKLDIRCYPKDKLPELLNIEKLKNLKRLYIRGGELTIIQNNLDWAVEILRLRFLKNLVLDSHLHGDLLKNLKCVEWEECPRLSTFSNGFWKSDFDEPFPGDKQRQWELAIAVAYRKQYIF